MQKTYRNWNLVLWATATVALACIGPAPQSAQAQNSIAGWPERGDFEVRKPENVLPKIRVAVARALKDGKFDDAEEEPSFVAYYEKSVFPNITDKANRQSKEDVIARLRNDLRSCERAEDKQVFNRLTDLILDYMTEIAGNDKCHPVARVNAMLAIGEVNSPKAAKVLLDEALSQKPVVFAIRVAAMTGLVRLAGPSGKRVLSDPEIEPLVVKNMVAVAQAKKRDDGVFWMRGQAADVLGELGTVGSQGEVPHALLMMLNDKGLPIPLRSKAARALGKLNYGENMPAAGPYVTALAEFAHDALSPDQPADRGRVRLVVRDVEDGRKKFASSTPSNDHALINGLKKTLEDLNKETAGAMTVEDLKTAIKKAYESLDSLLKK